MQVTAVFLSCVATSLLAWHSVPKQTTCQALVRTRLHQQLLTITGECRSTAPAAQALRYELSTAKQGPSGTAHNTQSGQFLLPAGATAVLSQTTIRVAAADTCRIRLRILDSGGQVIAEDSRLSPPQ